MTFLILCSNWVAEFLLHMKRRIRKCYIVLFMHLKGVRVLRYHIYLNLFCRLLNTVLETLLALPVAGVSRAPMQNTLGHKQRTRKILHLCMDLSLRERTGRRKHRLSQRVLVALWQRICDRIYSIAVLFATCFESFHIYTRRRREDGIMNGWLALSRRRHLNGNELDVVDERH